MQPQPTLNSVPQLPLNAVTTEQIQKCLDDNKNLILAILENQNLGKLAECAQYQAILQKNLMYLAAIADAQQPAAQGGAVNSSPQVVVSSSAAATQQMQQTQATTGGGGLHQQQQQAAAVPKLPFQLNNSNSNNSNGGGFPSPQEQQQMLHYHQQQQQQFQGHHGFVGGAAVNNGMHQLMRVPLEANSHGLGNMAPGQGAGGAGAGAGREE
ncbi:unnamed protein product [Cuscuta europaea]|uniref:SS18 N-terminal domain-containing protein n=1 Tax=Cuscuta europaea TaxID=41803 RepID=A0A9P1EKA4_CUSEU|nr:unnamed protein product [Cuscuta europaea]